jgi:hypothetical protein
MKNYVRPQITGIFDATRSIQSEKDSPNMEVDQIRFTGDSAYQASN